MQRDSGEDVQQVQEYLHPNSEHVIDWFHITMRLTVLQQQTKSLQEEGPQIGAAASKQVESVKHLLWHGNVEEALDRLANLLMESRSHSEALYGCGEAIGGAGGIRDLHSQQSGIDPELWRAVPAG